MIEYGLVHADKALILPQHLPPEVRSAPGSGRTDSIPPPQEAFAAHRNYRPPESPEEEMARILKAIEESGGNKAEAARRLGMSRTTLWKRLKQNGFAADET